MIFSGTDNYLSLPRVSSLAFYLRDIVVDSLDLYKAFFEFVSDGDEINAYFQPGTIFQLYSGIIRDQQNQFLGTYNTGIPFSISGWWDRNLPTYIDVDGAIYPNSGCTRNGKLANINISCPSNKSLACSIELRSQPLIYSLTLGSFNVGEQKQAQLACNLTARTYGTKLVFYNSVQTVLSGNSYTGYILGGSYTGITLTDVDPTYQNNAIKGYMVVSSLGQDHILDINTNRYIQSTGISTISCLGGTEHPTEGKSFSFGSIMQGIWSGSGYIPDIKNETLTVQFSVERRDEYGYQLDKSIEVFPNLGFPGGTILAHYLDNPSFTLTTGGEYTAIPTLASSGYYAVTGFQQALSSMLFSSGCSGNIGVLFDVPYQDSRATGNLLTQAISISGTYASGVNTYYRVTGYFQVDNGGGYTQAPKFVLNTGKYGVNCYDVPARYGDNSAFQKCTGYGATSISAGYLTGTVLCRTGLVGTPATITGYIVTGIDITNPGSGWGTLTYQPKISFTRQLGDSLTKNASGTLAIKDTILNNYENWTIETGTESQDFQLGSWGPTNISLDANQSTFNIRFTASGLNTTQAIPFTVRLTSLDDGVSTDVAWCEYARKFSDDPELLKKKSSVIGVYSQSQLLSFDLTQNELDLLYSSAGYTGFTLDLSDLNF